MADCSEWKVRTAAEEEGSKAETEAEEEKGGYSEMEGTDGVWAESVLELMRCVMLDEGPRRRPGRPGFPKALRGALELDAWCLSCRCGGVGMMGGS